MVPVVRNHRVKPRRNPVVGRRAHSFLKKMRLEKQGRIYQGKEEKTSFLAERTVATKALL